MKKLLLYLLLLLLHSGCQTIQNLTDSIRKPSLSVTDVRVTDFNFNEIELTYDVEVNNPNPVALQMLSYDYDLKISGNDFIKGDQNERLNIEGSGSSTFQIPMQLNFGELYRLFSGLRDKDTADYQLAANLAFDIPVLGETTLPLKKSGSLPMVKLPKASVSNLKVDNVSFSSADLVLNLNIDNPNSFGLLVNALSYDLEVNGKNWIDGTNSNDITIKKNNSSNIAILISLNIMEIGSSVIQLLNNSGNVNFNLHGNFDMGASHPLFKNINTNFSFDEAGKLPLIR